MASNDTLNNSLYPALQSCLFDKRVYDQYCLIPAVIIITVLAFLNKRVRIKPKICCGRPGLVFPFNFLGDSNNNRLSIAVAFGVIADSCYKLFIDVIGYEFLSFSTSSVIKIGQGSWGKEFTLVVWVLLYGMINFPIFACLTTEHLLVGAVFGLLYTLMKLAADLILVLSCPNVYAEAIIENGWDRAYQESELYIRLPDLLCHLFLLVRFSLLLTKELRKICRRRSLTHPTEDVTPVIAKQHDYIHMSLLLNNKLDDSLLCRSNASCNWYIRLRDKIYKPRQDFKFSTGLVSTLTVAVIFIYQMTVSSTILLSLFSMKVIEWREEVAQTDQKSFLKLFVEVYKEFEVSLYLSLFCTTVFSVLMILHFMKCHRDHVLMSYKRKEFFGNHPSRLVGRCLNYPGYQIAYIGWGYVSVVIFVFFLFFSIALCFKYMTWAFFRYLVKNVVPVIMVSICVWIFQYLLAWLVFRDRRLPDVTININNHRLYYVMSFFFFFFNILVGYFSSMLRTWKCEILEGFFMSRIDRSPLMLGYHQWDQGYMSYIGFLNVLKSFSHPVMLVFCQLLVDQRESRRRHFLQREVFVGDTFSQLVFAHDAEEQDRRLSRPSSKAAFNRWLVAYTLLKNPHLQQYRKRSLRSSFLTEIETSNDMCSMSLLVI